MKVAIALESPHANPRARALALGRKLAAGGELIAAACLVDATTDGPAVAARLGIRQAFFVADGALAKTGSRGRAQAVAGLLTRVRVDLVLVDAGSDGGGGIFSASLAYLGEMNGLFRVLEVERDDSAPDAVVAVLDVAGVRHRVRVELPAVISISGEAPAQPAIDPALVKSRTMSLVDLGVAADQLAREPIPGEAFVPAYRRPQVVEAIDDLLD